MHTYIHTYIHSLANSKNYFFKTIQIFLGEVFFRKEVMIFALSEIKRELLFCQPRMKKTLEFYLLSDNSDIEI